MVSRLLGLFIVTAGIVIGKFAILDPIHLAQDHAPSVSYSIKSFVLVPLAIVSGLALSLFGNRVAPIFLGAPQGFGQKAMAFVIMAIAFAATGIGWWMFKAQLSALGYGY